MVLFLRMVELMILEGDKDESVKGDQSVDKQNGDENIEIISEDLESETDKSGKKKL